MVFDVLFVDSFMYFLMYILSITFISMDKIVRVSFPAPHSSAEKFMGEAVNA